MRRKRLLDSFVQWARKVRTAESAAWNAGLRRDLEEALACLLDAEARATVAEVRQRNGGLP